MGCLACLMALQHNCRLPFTSCSGAHERVQGYQSTPENECASLISCLWPVDDLGFMHTKCLNPSSHIKTIYCKTLTILELVIKISEEFQLQMSIKTLYCSLVPPPTSEYGFIAHLSQVAKINWKKSSGRLWVCWIHFEDTSF